MADIAQIGFQVDTSGLKRADDALDDVARSGKRAEKSADNVSKASKRLGGSAGMAAAALRKLGPLLAAYASIQTVQGISSITAKFEDLEATLRVISGGAEQAAQDLEFIQDVAGGMPVSVDQLTQSFIQLKTAGIEPSRDLLMTFSDAASIAVDKVGAFEAITRIFARGVQGGLGLEELEQLSDRGIPVYDILADKLGKTRLQLSEVGQTAEGATKILNALAEGFNERFGGATQDALGNTTTLVSNLGDAFNILVADASKFLGIEQLIKGVLGVITDTFSGATQWIRTTKEEFGSLGNYMAQEWPTIIQIWKTYITAFMATWTWLIDGVKKAWGVLMDFITTTDQEVLATLEKQRGEVERRLKSIPGLWDTVFGGASPEKYAEDRAQLAYLDEQIAEVKKRITEKARAEAEATGASLLTAPPTVVPPQRQIMITPSAAAQDISAAEKAAEAAEELAKALEKVRRSADPLGQRMKELEGQQKTLDLALNKGAISWEEYADLTFGLADAMTELQDKIDGTGQAVLETAGPWKQFSDSIKDTMGNLQRSAISAFDKVSDGLMGLVKGTKTAKEAFSDMAESIIYDMIEMALRRQMLAAVEGIATSALGTAVSGFFGGLFGSAHGNVFSGGRVVPFANGGVVGGTTFFPMADGRTGMMGEAGPEAIMPLRRGRNGDLGVASSGGGASVVLNIIDNRQGGEKVEVKQTRDANGNQNIDVLIWDKVDKGIRMGRFDRANRDTYGLNRAGGGF